MPYQKVWSSEIRKYYKPKFCGYITSLVVFRITTKRTGKRSADRVPRLVIIFRAIEDV